MRALGSSYAWRPILKKKPGSHGRSGQSKLKPFSVLPKYIYMVFLFFLFNFLNLHLEVWLIFVYTSYIAKPSLDIDSSLDCQIAIYIALIARPMTLRFAFKTEEVVTKSMILTIRLANKPTSVYLLIKAGIMKFTDSNLFAKEPVHEQQPCHMTVTSMFPYALAAIFVNDKNSRKIGLLEYL